MKNKYIPEIRFSGFSGDWEQCKLESIYGKIRNAFVGTATPYYVEDGYFYLESNNVKDGQINRNTEVFINDEFYKKQKDNWLHTGDLVMVQSGHVGHTAVIPEELDNTAAHALIMFSNYREETNPYFLNYQFQTHKSKKKLASITTGNTIKHILASEMKEFLVDIPKYKEQQKIGDFFKKIDDIIALHQQELTTLKQTKQGFLQKMFPKEGESVPEVRFPGFTGDWEQRKVMDFSEETFGGGTPKTSIKEYWNGEIPWIQSSDLDEHQVSGVFAKKKITEKGLQNSATKLIPKNSIAIVTRVGVGKIALMQLEYATSQDFLSLSNLKVNEWFGVYSLYNHLQKELHNVQGTSIKGITKNELLDKKINIPTNLEEQNKIGKFFKQLDDTIALHQRELNALKETKKAFLQKMFA